MLGVPDATLLIAGDGPERGRLDALIVRLGLTDRVRLLGAVPHADLPRLIAAADVSALASSSEGLANAWVESLACGTHFRRQEPRQHHRRCRRSEEHTSELQALLRISYAVFCLKKKKNYKS